MMARMPIPMKTKAMMGTPPLFLSLGGAKHVSTRENTTDSLPAAVTCVAVTDVQGSPLATTTVTRSNWEMLQAASKKTTSTESVGTCDTLSKERTRSPLRSAHPTTWTVAPGPRISLPFESIVKLPVMVRLPVVMVMFDVMTTDPGMVHSPLMHFRPAGGVVPKAPATQTASFNSCE